MAHARFETRKEQHTRLKKERRAQRRAKRRHPLVANLEREFQELSAVDVIALLCDEFHLDNITVQFSSGKAIELWRLRETIKDPTVGAAYISPVTFWGGPPGPFKKFSGSILTVLYDAILRAWVRTGAYADLVGREYVH